MTHYRTLLDCETLNQHLGDPRWVVLDCRFNLMDTEAGRNAYRQAHIPGALYVHLDDQLSSAITAESGRHPLPSAAQLAAWLQQSGVTADSQVVAYDDMGGAMAARCWWLLRTLGHQRVALLDGGYPAWCKQGFSVSAEVPAPGRHRSQLSKGSQLAEGSRLAEGSQLAEGSGRPSGWNAGAVVSADEVLHNLEGLEFLLVDARNRERYRGEQEPIDPVAGHVPGAFNRPLQLNLQADGEFKSASTLKQEWLQLLGDRSPQQIVHMCGSGVTACHNLLAMEHAGLVGSRVYAGSWSEWIRDPQRPVATA